MRKWELILLTASLVCAGAFAENVDLAKSEITFTFKQENVPGQGRFKRFSSQISVDASNPAAARATVEVDATSIDIGEATWNQEIQGEDWFNVRRFPKATFATTGVARPVAGHFDIPAKFTLKGISRDVVVSYTVKSAGTQSLIEGSLPIKRSDFKIGEGAWADPKLVADDVIIRFKLVVKK